ncbi:unnamed protein product, partial [Linum tenue]
KRYKVAIGIAEGLRYLHHDCPRRIIHRDIKASNILLGEDYEAQAKPLLEDNDVSTLVDPRLGNDFDPIEMKRAMVTAFLCIDHVSKMRPSMSRVVQFLNGEDLAIDMVMISKTNSGRAVILDASDLQDYTCTNYLNDLNRHMQLVME